MLSSTAVLLLATSLCQSTPVEIPKAELPKAAVCTACAANGETHGPEKPAGGVKLQGKVYYFCNRDELKAFLSDPGAYLPPELPRSLPTFELTDNAGATWNRDALSDKVVLIDWWATWCVPCKEMMPVLDKIQEKFRSEGLVLLSVSIDEKKLDFDRFVAKRKFANPVIWDGRRAWAEFSVRAIPALILVDHGKIVGQWRGKQTQATIEAAVRRALED